jgi:hypothetical protein
MSRYSRGPKRRPLSSITPRDMDAMREHFDREREFEHNSGEHEGERRQDRIEREQMWTWLTPVDEDAAA